VRVTVLGGSGFLGSHVADHLSVAGHEVVVFDSVPSKWIQAGQRMVIGDLLDFESVLDATRGSEAVFNFAAVADISEARLDPMVSASVNVLGNINALQACVENGIRRFILASSLYVYSDAGSFYRCSKQAAELYVEEFGREHGLEYTILRFGSLYGPRSDEKNGLRQIVRRAVEKGELSYVGSPDATREYIHVYDAAAAAVKSLDLEFVNQQIVLSGQQSIKVVELLQTLAEILSMDPKTIAFHEAEDPGHYIRTPYTHRSQVAKKLTPNFYVDLGQGLVELIRDVENEIQPPLAPP